MQEVIENVGAGEGNRTLVFSLEGHLRLNAFKARSEPKYHSRRIEPLQVLSSFRTAALPQAISVAITTTTTKKNKGQPGYTRCGRVGRASNAAGSLGAPLSGTRAMEKGQRYLEKKCADGGSAASISRNKNTQPEERET